MNLLRLDTSIRTLDMGSGSRRLADTAEQVWRAANPDGTVTRRDLAENPLPSEAWGRLVRTVVDPGATVPAEAQRLVDELADEVLAADAFLFAVPMYNWNLPAQMKLWLDLIFTHQRLGVHGDQPLRGKPAVLVLSRGGGYGPGAPKEGWDHGTPYLRRILSEVLELDLRVAEAELTHAFRNPEMASLRDLAEVSLRRGLASAAEHGAAASGSTAA